MPYETIPAGDWLERARVLDDDGWILADVTGLDRLHIPAPDHIDRFEVVVQLIHRERRERMTVHVPAPGDPPTVPSVVPVWKHACAPEREVFDLFGIHFEGHPNLIRIMLPDEWEGHPLRKDYGVGRVTVEFVPQPFLQIDAPGQDPASAGARQPVDRLGQAGPPERAGSHASEASER